MLNFYCFIFIADDKDFSSQCIVTFAVKLAVLMKEIYQIDE